MIPRKTLRARGRSSTLKRSGYAHGSYDPRYRHPASDPLRPDVSRLRTTFLQERSVRGKDGSAAASSRRRAARRATRAAHVALASLPNLDRIRGVLGAR